MAARAFLKPRPLIPTSETTDGPTQIYLVLSAIDAARPVDRRLSAGTAQLLAAKYIELCDWYPIFVEFPALDDDRSRNFISIADHIAGISNPALRSNALGSFQAEVGIWQILARQKQIAESELNSSWQNTVQPYTEVSSSTQLFDAARKSLQTIVEAAGSEGNTTEDQVVHLLAGPAQSDPDAAQIHNELAHRMRAVLDDQRLASLDTLFRLYDGLGELAKGANVGDSLLPLAGTLREFELPRPIFTEGERVTWSPSVYISRHAELQVRTDLTKVTEGPGHAGTVGSRARKTGAFPARHAGGTDLRLL